VSLLGLLGIGIGMKVIVSRRRRLLVSSNYDCMYSVNKRCLRKPSCLIRHFTRAVERSSRNWWPSYRARWWNNPCEGLHGFSIQCQWQW